MPLHHVLPNPEVLVELVLAEKVDGLQLVVHVLLGHPLLPTHEIGFLLDELSYSLAAYRHVLVGVAFVELHNPVVIGVRVLVEVKEI